MTKTYAYYFKASTSLVFNESYYYVCATDINTARDIFKDMMPKSHITIAGKLSDEPITLSELRELVYNHENNGELIKLDV